MPRSKIKRLLDEVTCLAPLCDDSTCKELIFITGDMTECSKFEKKKLRKDWRSDMVTATNKLERLVDQLKARQVVHDRRAKKQLFLAKKLHAEKGIKMQTEVGPVPKTRTRLPPDHPNHEASELLHSILGW